MISLTACSYLFMRAIVTANTYLRFNSVTCDKLPQVSCGSHNNLLDHPTSEEQIELKQEMSLNSVSSIGRSYAPLNCQPCLYIGTTVFRSPAARHN